MNPTAIAPDPADFAGRFQEIYAAIGGRGTAGLSDRVPDGLGALEGIVREDKAIKGPLSRREMEQLATNLTMLERGLRFEVPNGTHGPVTLQVERVVYDCVYPGRATASSAAGVPRCLRTRSS